MSSDFFTQGPLRQFELVFPANGDGDAAESKSLWVNGLYLASLSPYFHSLCAKEGYAEASTGKATISDVKVEEMALLLLTIHPGDDYVIAGRIIDGEDFFPLLKLADRFLLSNLLAQLDDFAESDEQFRKALSALPYGQHIIPPLSICTRHVLPKLQRQLAETIHSLFDFTRLAVNDYERSARSRRPPHVYKLSAWPKDAEKCYWSIVFNLLQFQPATPPEIIDTVLDDMLARRPFTAIRSAIASLRSHWAAVEGKFREHLSTMKARDPGLHACYAALLDGDDSQLSEQKFNIRINPSRILGAPDDQVQPRAFIERGGAWAEANPLTTVLRLKQLFDVLCDGHIRLALFGRALRNGHPLLRYSIDEKSPLVLVAKIGVGCHDG